MSLGAFWRTSFHQDTFSKFQEIYNAAKECRTEENGEMCERLVHALTNSLVIENDFQLARRIAAHFCESKKRGKSCFQAGEISLKNFEIEDGRSQAKEFFKNACILGNASGCRRFAELIRDDPNSPLWALAGYQIAKEELQKPNPSDINEQNIEIQKEETGKQFYAIHHENHEFSNKKEILLNLSLFLQQKKNIEVNEIDTEKLRKKSLEISGFLQKFSRDFVFLTKDTNLNKDWDTEISKLSHKLEDKIGNIPSDIPTTNQQVNTSHLENLLSNSLARKEEQYKKYCFSAKDKNAYKCFKLSSFYNELYFGSGELKYLKNAVKGFDKNCTESGDFYSCNELVNLYSTSAKLPSISDRTREFNAKRWKYYSYQACQLEPASCYEFASFLKQENDSTNYILMITHACKKGASPTACKILKEHLAALAKDS